MRILCRLGLHSWKPVCRHRTIPFSVFADEWRAWFQIAHTCRRCGKRVRL